MTQPLNQGERERLLQSIQHDPELQEALRRHLLTDELIEMPERFAQFAAYVEAFITQQQTHNASVEETLSRLTIAVGDLRGDAAARLLRSQDEEVASMLDLTIFRLLSRTDLQALSRQARVDNTITHGERQSFVAADLVFEATDQDRRTHYVAAEASYTADLRDTNRAIRNARLLTLFTRHPAHPVVASVNNDREAQEIIDTDTVHWHQLLPADLRPD